MSNMKGPPSISTWEKGPRAEQMNHRQSRNTNTSIFYVHNYEKEETDKQT